VLTTTNPPSPRELQRWYPQSFTEIAGNKLLVQTLHDFTERGPANLLVTGPTKRRRPTVGDLPSDATRVVGNDPQALRTWGCAV
jgi:hypothetical protein